jgi:hypothetical protein
VDLRAALNVISYSAFDSAILPEIASTPTSIGEGNCAEPFRLAPPAFGNRTRR